ncbi:MAG: hypothetical protein ACOYNZ_19955 [Rhodoferax sp.]
MKPESVDVVDLVWDLARERLTIGGALVLRQEGEMLARLQGHSALTLHLIGPQSGRQAAERMARSIFGASIYPYHQVDATDSAFGSPSAAVRAEPDFSYFSFSRITALYAQTGLKPRLQWSQLQQATSLQARRHFAGRLYCVHLRSVAPFVPEESNADGLLWNAFFQRRAAVGQCDFLLIGDDPLPAGLDLRPGVTRAASSALGLDLAGQLALIGVSDGFLGMASGLCTAANFSETPHVIFKHPAHHAAEMMRELGTAHAFAFADERQQLWRREAGVAALDEAFHLISS